MFSGAVGGSELSNDTERLINGLDGDDNELDAFDMSE